MGSKISKIEKGIELSKDAADYAKKFSSELNYVVIRLMEEYQYKFTYGLNGLNNPYAEVIAPDEVLKELVEKLPYEYTKDLASIKKRKRLYDDLSNLKKYEWELNREQSNELFSLYKNVEPQLDRVWLHYKEQQSKFKEFTKEEIQKAYYDEDYDENFVKIKENFLGNARYTTRRITVLFGDHGTKKDLCMRLVYYKNARPSTKCGILRLYFFYYTYDDSELVHELYCIHKKKKSNYNKKRRTNVPNNENKMKPLVANNFDQERRNKQLESFRKMEEEHYKDYTPDGKIKPEILEKRIEERRIIIKKLREKEKEEKEREKKKEQLLIENFFK